MYFYIRASFCILYLSMATSYAQSPTLTWMDKNKSALRVSLPDREEIFKECADAGFEVRLRYEIELCRSRSFWFSSCSDTLVAQKSLSYDPVGEQYQLGFDIFGDKLDPVVSQYVNPKVAVKELAQFKGVRLEWFSGVEKVSITRSRVRLKIDSECRGFDDSLAKMSSLIRMGIVKIHKQSTGWVNFTFSDKER